MTDLVQRLAPQILSEITRARRVLLHCHPSPDPDSVGGALATAEVLKQLGKEVVIIRGDSDIPTAFEQFPGIDQIVPQNFFQIDLNQFDLFIILDSAAIGQVSKEGEINFPSTLRTILIDHHESNPGFAELNLIDSTYIANCELLYDLFSLWSVTFTSAISTNLLMGLYADSGGFQYAGTTEHTFSAAAALARVAPDFTKIIFGMNNHNTKEALLFEGLAFSTIEVAAEGKVALAAVGYQSLVDHHISRSDAQVSVIAEKLRSVTAWQIGICLAEKQPGAVSASFRSRDPEQYNVAELAAQLGGGGHAAAAGAMLKMDLAEAKVRVLAAVNNFPF